jgi:hypothetical protein
VVPAFAASADFAIDKPATTPCPNLATDFRCTIHERLRPAGFVGCTVYDCFGAGQRITQHTFGGRTWRESPDIAHDMYEAFPIMRELHELLWYLAEAVRLRLDGDLPTRLADAEARINEITGYDVDRLRDLDRAALWGEVNELLRSASREVRAGVGSGRSWKRDQIGAKLRRADLRGAELRGAYLIGADLTGADLRWADLIGADLRAAELAGADLSSALFLTGPQVASARGDRETRLPAHLPRPAHWHDASAELIPGDRRA